MAIPALKVLVVLSLVSVLVLGMGSACTGRDTGLQREVLASSAETSVMSQSASQDPRPNLWVDPSGFYVLRDDQNVSSGMFGMDFHIHVTVRNLGESSALNFSVFVGARNVNGESNFTIFDNTYNILNTTNDTVHVDVDWRLLTTVEGTCEIWACADLANNLDESNETDNFVTIQFDILRLETDVVVTTGPSAFKGGDTIYITALVTYAGTLEGVEGAQISFFLTDSNAAVVSYTETTIVTTDPSGHVVHIIMIPTWIDTGVYYIGARVFDEGKVGLASVNIAKASSEPLQEPVNIPTLVIVAIVAPAAVILLVYWFRLSKRLR